MRVRARDSSRLSWRRPSPLFGDTIWQRRDVPGNVLTYKADHLGTAPSCPVASIPALQRVAVPEDLLGIRRPRLRYHSGTYYE